MKPLIMTDENVLQIMNGTKTQTRRIIKLQPDIRTGKPQPDDIFRYHITSKPCWVAYWSARGGIFRPVTPRYQPGEICYIKEKWRVTAARTGSFEISVRYSGPISTEGFPASKEFILKDMKQFDMAWRWYQIVDVPLWEEKWNSSRYMPAWAARTFVQIERTWAEKLEDISEEDARAEGVSRGTCTHPDCYPGSCASSRYRPAFAELWNSIHGKGAWALNLWNWCYEFKKVEKPEE